MPRNEHMPLNIKINIRLIIAFALAIVGSIAASHQPKLEAQTLDAPAALVMNLSE